MFNAATIQSELSGLIGIRQHHNTGYDRIDSDVAASSAGLYIDQSAHSLLTIENIMSCVENFSTNNVSTYSNTITYGKGDIVKSAGIIYESKVADNINHTPVSSGDQWMVTNLASAYLRRLLNSASINLFNAVFNHRKLFNLAKTILSDTSLYDGVGNLSRKITKFSRFVGYRISPNFPDTVINITSAGFQFDQVNASFKLYVYHSSQSQPLQVINLALTKAVSFEWKKLESMVTLPYNNDTLNTKGYFYIGYYEDDLTGQAIWKEQGFSGSACSSCNSIDSYLYRQWSKYFSIKPVYIENAWLDSSVDRTLFEEEKAIELNNQNWGLNLKIQVMCDVTDFIVRNKVVFGDALRKQVVHDLLRDMAYSGRDNQKREKVSQMAFYALENKENHTKGVIKELEEAIKNVSFDMSSMNKVCLPCESGSNGVVISSVF